ncbi:hypothetical protein LP419_18640 [Massilia sp. H-1]|nr:hypothetical protein LP419_18640 [Massilia sp. H-1]
MSGSKPVHAPQTQFPVIDDCLQVGGMPLTRLAQRVGATPFYAYDRGLLSARVAHVRSHLPPEVALHYSIKANPMPKPWCSTWPKPGRRSGRGLRWRNESRARHANPCRAHRLRRSLQIGGRTGAGAGRRLYASISNRNARFASWPICRSKAASRRGRSCASIPISSCAPRA